MSKRIGMTIGVAVFAAGAWLAAPAEAAGVKIGVLTCNVDSGWGYILGSSKDVRCNYVPNKGFGEHYNGSISKVGVDIGYVSGATIIWAVISRPDAIFRTVFSPVARIFTLVPPTSITRIFIERISTTIGSTAAIRR